MKFSSSIIEEESLSYFDYLPLFGAHPDIEYIFDKNFLFVGQIHAKIWSNLNFIN